MYDTFSAVLREPPVDLLDPRRWQRVREDVSVETGEVVRKMTTNRGGLLLTLHPGGALQAERSLPKVYRGENVTDLSGVEAAVAVGMMDADIADALGTSDLPSFWDWMVVRGDYPRSIQLESEGEVLRTLEKFGDIELPYKGRPVIGQSHSVTWAKGAIHVKAYSKFSESDDPRARGVLRVEPGVFRARSFRRLLGVASDAVVTVGEALSPAVFEMVHAKFERVLRGDVMSAQEISDGELFDELVSKFGIRRAVTLLGWGLAFAMKGVHSRSDMLQVGLGGVATRYRVVADYRDFRDHLLAKGYVLSELGDEVSDVEGIADRFAKMAVAA